MKSRELLNTRFVSPSDQQLWGWLTASNSARPQNEGEGKVSKTRPIGASRRPLSTHRGDPYQLIRNSDEGGTDSPHFLWAVIWQTGRDSVRDGESQLLELGRIEKKRKREKEAQSAMNHKRGDEGGIRGKRELVTYRKKGEIDDIYSSSNSLISLTCP